ncbi:methyltransferase domain-containing protein [uncultured Methylobacterium sp.]|uniref:methyltransferase domain-containing protein n=1 Tax=uncultured Methylobacterium sp. TaxID=157278 RepID=UPI0035C9F32F
MKANPDVAKAGFDPLEHFLIHGLSQNYQGWYRKPEAPPLDPIPDAIPGGISEWFQGFRDTVRATIVDMEQQAIADPHNAPLHEGLGYYWFHESRWVMTFRIMAPFIEKSASVIEVGGQSIITHFLGEQGMRVAVTTNDLRTPMTDVTDASHDVALCLEVIEHIKDQDGSGPVDIFNGSGVRCLVSEMHRILKPGGIAVCTTPNGCAYSSIAKALKMEPPMFFRKHVREFTPDELREAFESAGFETDYLETPPQPWERPKDLDIGMVCRMVEYAGGSSRLREDDMVAIFRKR